MMVLETLKDIEEEKGGYINRMVNHNVEQLSVIPIDDLRGEAIKWAKYRNHKVDSDWCEFFDITDKELKDANVGEGVA